MYSYCEVLVILTEVELLFLSGDPVESDLLDSFSVDDALYAAMKRERIGEFYCIPPPISVTFVPCEKFFTCPGGTYGIRV